MIRYKRSNDVAFSSKVTMVERTLYPNKVESWLEQRRTIMIRRRLIWSNSVKLRVKQGRYGQTGSNHESNKVDTVKQCRIKSQTGSNIESSTVDRVEHFLIMSQTRSNHESNRVESRAEQGRNFESPFNVFLEIQRKVNS